MAPQAAIYSLKFLTSILSIRLLCGKSVSITHTPQRNQVYCVAHPRLIHTALGHSVHLPSKSLSFFISSPFSQKSENIRTDNESLTIADGRTGDKQIDTVDGLVTDRQDDPIMAEKDEHGWI